MSTLPPAWYVGITPKLDDWQASFDDVAWVKRVPMTLSPLTVPIDTTCISSGRYTTTKDNHAFEFAFQQSLIVQTGAIPDGSAWGAVSNRGGDGKVLRFAEAQVKPGGGTTWVDNTVLSLAAGTNSTGFLWEGDLDNRDSHKGDGDGVAGIYPSLANPSDSSHPPVAAGIILTGAGNYRSTTAMWIDGVRFDATTNQAFPDLWNRGITIVRGTKQHDYGTYSSATRAFRDTGTHAFSLDLQNATNSIGAISLKANATSGKIFWSTGTAVTGSITCGPDATMLVDTEAFRLNAACIPDVDNAFVLGTSALRWSQIWAVDGTVHTSDPSTKRDVAEIAPDKAAAFVMSLRPVSYRLNETTDLVDSEADHQVPDLDEDGNEIVDYEPVVDANGAPVMHEVKEDAGVTRRGKPVTSTRQVPLMQQKPRLRTIKYVKKVPVSRPGKRLHTGLMSTHVRDAGVAAFGESTGAYVSPGDGPEGVRYDEVIAPLIALVQDLYRQVQTLKAGTP